MKIDNANSGLIAQLVALCTGIAGAIFKVNVLLITLAYFLQPVLIWVVTAIANTT